MQNPSLSRQHLMGAILLLYFIPMALVCFCSTLLFFPHFSWSLIGVGLLLTSAGSIIFFVSLLEYSVQFEKRVEINEETDEIPIHFVEQETENKIEELQSTIDFLEEERRKCDQHEKEQFHKFQILQKEFDDFKKLANHTIENEKSKLNDTIETISELRTSVDYKQKQIKNLQTKIHDLTYEIKTLLEIADLTHTISSPDSEPIGLSINESAQDYQVPIKSQSLFTEESLPAPKGDEAEKQLKRCIDIAQKITGAQHFTENKSRFGEFSLDNYALDLRRLCDSLRSENHCTVFVYSLKEKKLIFTNNQVRDLLGWNPEKFVQDFDNIVQEGVVEWENSIAQLNTLNYGKTRFVMKAKSGKDLLVHCQLGLIPTGVFRSSVIGVLYPA